MRSRTPALLTVFSGLREKLSSCILPMQQPAHAWSLGSSAMRGTPSAIVNTCS
ncbi:hypothetical protein PF005_g33606 [Phytophthora fragariae]|uniref:Uncharacterized protein n=1 Tax=Phytophthora fragariae TaxID=53985 RepID=A0A6A3PGA9_9STRA|nr:hypothetical protein PF006_g33470 [Phytophthora fragariae]KAE9147664.1 hypothetical protein PF005_g33606 [Phytophthora fragariae]KAE9254071.1 hypothetical protein PF001_g33407 [Phytophthora fragariae]